MGLEIGTYISDLDPTNPVHLTDPVSQGDDHLRLIKATILNSFPNITGAMNASQTELNNLVGVTGKTGTGNLVLSAAPVFTGLVTADSFAGDGAALTGLDAANIDSGVLANARVQQSNVTQHEGAITHDNLGGVSIGEHIDHNSVAINAGDGLSGGGTILLSRTIDVDSTVIRTTGTQSIGGAKTFTGNLIASDDFMTDGVISTASTGAINAQATAGASIIRFTGGAQVTLNGMANGLAGKRVIVINQTSAVLLLNTESGSASAANRLRFQGSASISVDDSFEFIYDGNDSRWQLVAF